MSWTDLRLETSRLILRVPRLEDFDRFAELHAHEEATRFLGGPVSRGAAWRRFLVQPGAWVIQGFGSFAVIDRTSGRWLGQLGPWRPEGWPGNEVGFAFHPEAWGQGYALEAGLAAMDWCFETLGWEDIIHCIEPENAASLKLAAKLGSTRRGPVKMPPPFEDASVELWGQTREEWRTQRREQPLRAPLTPSR